MVIKNEFIVNTGLHLYCIGGYKQVKKKENLTVKERKLL